MEVFNVNKCSEDGIDLTSADQLESLLDKIKDSEECMVKWTEEDDGGYDVKRSKILLTESLMSRIKDGRFSLTSTKKVEED